jgi:hypothetical protein
MGNQTSIFGAPREMSLEFEYSKLKFKVLSTSKSNWKKVFRLDIRDLSGIVNSTKNIATASKTQHFKGTVSRDFEL